MGRLGGMLARGEPGRGGGAVIWRDDDMGLVRWRSAAAPLPCVAHGSNCTYYLYRCYNRRHGLILRPTRIRQCRIAMLPTPMILLFPCRVRPLLHPLPAHDPSNWNNSPLTADAIPSDTSPVCPSTLSPLSCMLFAHGLHLLYATSTSLNRADARRVPLPRQVLPLPYHWYLVCRHWSGSPHGPA